MRAWVCLCVHINWHVEKRLPSSDEAWLCFSLPHVIEVIRLFVCSVTFSFSGLQVLLDQSTKANSPLKGHERTVQYLQRLGKPALSKLQAPRTGAMLKQRQSGRVSCHMMCSTTSTGGCCMSIIYMKLHLLSSEL